MGYIIECRDAGIPEELLIPIQPPYFDHNTKDVEGGKTPAVLNSIGEWVPIKGWQNLTTPWELKAQADTDGANCGLVLGCSGNTPNGPVAFAAMDIDFKKGQEAQRDLFINHFASIWPGSALLIRETVPHRALLLIRITDTFSSGHKGVYYLKHKDEDIGGIELLTTGQQCIIAGHHYSGNEIAWFVYGADERSRTPRTIDNMLAFPTFVDLAEAVRSELEKLGGLGYTYASSTAGGGELVPEAHLVPSWLTVQLLIDYIRKTPNPESLDRQGYVGFMEAIAACKHGLEVRQGPLAPDQLDRLLNNAAEWAAKWPGNAGKADVYQTERAKCENDWFKQRGDFRTSWIRLVRLAEEFGYKDAVSDAAQTEFMLAKLVDHTPPPAQKDDIPINAVREGSAFDCIENDQTSDIGVAKSLALRENRLGQIFAYMPPTKKWLAWSGVQDGWEENEGHVEWRVQQELLRYTAKYGQNPEQAWEKSKIEAMLSNRKVKGVKECLGRELTKDARDIKPSMYHLQTKGGTYDLRTLQLLSLPERKEMFDTRITTVSPNFNNLETPNFDKLVYGLCDENEEVVNWLWHYVGYALLGNPREECFVVVWGPGENGKSKFTEALTTILGGYAVDMNENLLLKSGEKLHPTSLMQLANKRVSIANDVPTEGWNESLLKRLTGGDRIAARDMYQSETTFQNESSLLVTCNKIPPFSQVNRATLRRFRVIGTSKTPAKRDTSLITKILTYEAGSVLAKMMMYAQRVWNPAAEGMENHVVLPPVPQAMERHAQKHLEESDNFFAWLCAECEVGAAAMECEETIDDLKARFDSWAQRTGKGAGGIVGDNINDKKFREALKMRGSVTVEENGEPLRRTVNAGAQRVTQFIARGIKLKVKAVS